MLIGRRCRCRILSDYILYLCDAFDGLQHTSKADFPGTRTRTFFLTLEQVRTYCRVQNRGNLQLLPSTEKYKIDINVVLHVKLVKNAKRLI